MSLLIPFSQDPLAVVAEQILDHYQDTLPDLSRCRVLVADTQCAPQLRAELLRQAALRGHAALLGPVVERLDSWLQQIPCTTVRVLDRPAQELVLAEALRHAQPVYADTDPWLLADQLLTLFDELTHHLVPVPERLDDFQSAVQQGYGIQTPSPALQQEAWVLHTLWHAWHRQLAEDNCIDTATAHLARLRASLEQAPEQDLWLLGFDRFTPAEAGWLRDLQERRSIRLLLHGNARHDGNHPDEPLHRLVRQLSLQDLQETPDNAPLARFLAALFDPSDLDLVRRAQEFADTCPQDPLQGRLTTFCADDPEQEARAVALQVKRWLLDDIRPIALVTDDRRLARRVRALLEASGIALDDPGGWALSTTSAAATLERWLESVEEDFACGPLLDVLKSPFVSVDTREAHLARVRRLEQDIILHENIARGLQRYRRHLDLRSERLPGGWSDDTRRELHSLLNLVDHAAGPLLPLLEGRHAVHEFLAALQQSLDELGVRRALATDAAGQQLLELLQHLQTAATHAGARLDWAAFRNWLGRNLERATFSIPPTASPVRLLTLAQTRLQRFGAVIVAACSSQHLPGSPPGQTFFNQRVRAQLGLPTWTQAQNHTLHHFCRVLHSAGRILLTRHAENDGEPVAASPWLELLETFHANAWHGTLHDAELQRLLRHPDAQPASPDSADLPQPAQRPAPRAPRALQPRTWSAYTHQRIVDCPYRFFAADTLGLKPRDEIREALSKSDYGALIHRVLQAFHSDVRRLPGPWRGSVGGAGREPALALLTHISEAVFADAVRDNFQARNWLHQWLACLPAYLDWLDGREAHWQLDGVEVEAERRFGEHLHLKGRVDRVDRHAGALAVVDYKTGSPPAGDDVIHGEAVQLPSYALLLDGRVEQLEYLQLGQATVTPAICAQDEQLQTLLTGIAGRLSDIDQALEQQAELPAWGDERVCSYCEFSGLCRRDCWHSGGDAA